MYRRIHDGFEMGKTIHLGIDHSTGEPREDKEEYYEEVKDERAIINALQNEIEQLEDELEDASAEVQKSRRSLRS